MDKTTISKKKAPIMERIEAFKNMSLDIHKSDSEMSKEILNTSVEYRKQISASHDSVYKIYQIGMENAKTEEERNKIFEEIRFTEEIELQEMREHNETNEELQRNFLEQGLKMLFSFAVVTELVKHRKSIIEGGKNVIKLLS